MSARLGFVLLSILFLAPVPAGAQCSPNGGGPNRLELLLDERESWDIDLGASGVLHNLEVPGNGQRDARLAVCLAGCDAASDSTCGVTGTLQIDDTGAFAGLVVPPIPLYAGSAPFCVAIGVPSPRPAVSGDFDVATGSFALSTTLNMAIHAPLVGPPCPQCIRGRCDSGPREDQRCAVDGLVTLGQDRLEVSRDCPPPVAGSFRVPVSITNRDYTGGACPNESSFGPCLGSCGTTGCTAPATGVAQQCCGAQPASACFFNSSTGQFVRSGTAATPLPAWPDPLYPKATRGNVVVAGGCLGAIGTPSLDSGIGLPGPVAMLLPVSLARVLSQVDTTTTSTLPGNGTTTTTIGAGATTTTTVPATCTAASCDDGNACTDDACGTAGCSHALRAGTAGLRCLVGRLRTGQPCGADPITAKYAKQIDKALGKADTLLGKVDAASGKKRAKAVKKVVTALNGATNKVKAALKKKGVTSACSDTLAEGIADVAVGTKGLGT